MRREKKIEIRVCKTKDNRFTVDDFAALADERTRIIVMSTLEWCNGWASDMKPSAISVRKRGSSWWWTRCSSWASPRLTPRSATLICWWPAATSG